METTTTRAETTVVAVISGHIDQTNAPEFQSYLESCVEAGDRALVLNLQDVSYITSAGLRSILVATKTLRSLGVKLVLCSINDDVSGVFRISGFEKIIPTYPSQDQAIAALK